MASVTVKRVRIDLASITSGETFHDFFAQRFNFPSYYGRSMDAWIDCMEDFAIGEDFLVLDLEGMLSLKARCPEIYEAINECSAFINYRAVESGGGAGIALCCGNS